LIGLGWKTREVAERVHVSPCTIRHWTTSPTFREAVQKAAAEVRQTVIALTAQEIVGAEPMGRRGHGDASPARR